MTQTRKSPARTTSREDRLKAALKANLGRRKAQARARAASEDQTDLDTAPKAPEDRP